MDSYFTTHSQQLSSLRANQALVDYDIDGYMTGNSQPSIASFRV